jgi:hypothetical protein
MQSFQKKLVSYFLTLSAKKYGIAVKIVSKCFKNPKKKTEIYTIGRFSENPTDEIF